MSGTVSIDIIEGARWKEVGGRVVEISRLAIVSGITVDSSGIGTKPGAKGESIFPEALNATGMPRPGNGHPIHPRLRVIERRPHALSTNIVQVEIVYREPDASSEPPPGFTTRVRGSTTLEQVETQLDRDGNQIVVVHNGVTQGGAATVKVPRDDLVFTRLEQSLAPGAISRAYTGRTNSQLWQSGLPGQWLCREIPWEWVPERETDPPTWRFTYVFEFNPDGHDPQVYYVDPDTGQPPPGLVAGEGFKTVPFYQQANFDELGLL